MKRILLLTSEYPFGVGEPYIEEEIRVLSGYTSVNILPACELKESDNQRSIDEKTKLLIPSTPKCSRAWMWVRSVFCCEFFFGLQELFKQNKYGLRSAFELIRFIHAARYRLAQVLQTTKDYGIDVDSDTVVYSYWMDSTALCAAWLRSFGARAICRAHGGDLYDERTPWNHQFLRKYLVRNLNAVYPVSMFGQKYLENRTGERGKILCSRLGIRHNGEGLLPRNSDFHLVSCSSLIPLKHVDLIIRALAQLETTCDQNVTWTHIGDGPERNRLECLADECLRKTHFRFLGQLDHDNVIQFYQQNPVSLFISVSETEGIPVSIMEALSFGIPVVATNVGGVCEIVNDGENGYLLPSNCNLTEVCMKIMKVINSHPIEYSLLRNRAKVCYMERWSSQRNYTEFYENIIE